MWRTSTSVTRAVLRAWGVRSGRLGAVVLPGVGASAYVIFPSIVCLNNFPRLFFKVVFESGFGFEFTSLLCWCLWTIDLIFPGLGFCICAMSMMVMGSQGDSRRQGLAASMGRKGGCLVFVP